MFFLFDNKPSFTFYQIFINSNTTHLNDESIIYNLTNNNCLKTNNNENLISNINFKIRILDNLISFCDIDTDNISSFSFTSKFLKNINNNIFFENIYNKIDQSNFPLFIDDDYDNIFNINIKTFKINTNLYLISEFNNVTSIKKQFFVSNNCDDCDSYYDCVSKLKKFSHR